MADEFCLKMLDFHITFGDGLHAVILRHGTNDFTSLPKEGVLRIFFALKNQTASAGFEPANLGTKGQHATCRPPKPFFTDITSINNKNSEVVVVDCCYLCINAQRDEHHKDITFHVYYSH